MTADVQLLRDLGRIAADPLEPKWTRTLARLGARALVAWTLRGGTVGPRWPLHGRYCGHGRSGPGEPIDSIDAACRQHDRRCDAAGGRICPKRQHR